LSVNPIQTLVSDAFISLSRSLQLADEKHVIL